VSTPFESRGLGALGELVRHGIGNDVAVEQTGWAPELCASVCDRLQEGTPEELRYVPVVLWMSRANAFIAPGRYVYITRALLDRPGMSEPAVALALAHEMAHGDLGHTGGNRFRFLPLPILIPILFAQRAVYSTAMESDADAHGLVRCLAAGYDGAACVKLFDVLAHLHEDYGAIDAAYGETKKGASHPTVVDRILRLRTRFPSTTRA
jgi:predicted Zn-dependent protease